jgi:hypothetical protein
MMTPAQELELKRITPAGHEALARNSRGKGK